MYVMCFKDGDLDRGTGLIDVGVPYVEGLETYLFFIYFLHEYVVISDKDSYIF